MYQIQVLKKKWAGLLIMVCCSIVCSQTFVGSKYNQLKYNTVRIAYWESPTDMTEDFLSTAQQNGYNYILFSVTIAGTPVRTKNDLKINLINAFKKVDQHKMRLIPFISIGSPYSTWLDLVCPTGCQSTGWTNKGVEWPGLDPKNDWWNQTWPTPTREFQTVDRKTPAIADETGIDGGVDNILIEIFQLFRDAHKEAKVSYPLEFIHLGHDEPIVHGPDGWDPANGKMDIELIYGLKQTSDQKYINDSTPKYTVNVAFQKLLINELFRRAHQIKDNINPQTKLLIWSDMFDPEQEGGKLDFVTYKTNRSIKPYQNTVKFVPDLNSGILTLPGLTNSEKSFFKENVILMPWNYRTFCMCDYKRNPYYSENTFTYYKKMGFKFIYTSAIGDECKNGTDEQDAYDMMNNYVTASKNYMNNCLGYAATQYSNSCRGGMDRTVMQERLFQANKSAIPKNSYYPDITPVTNLLLLD